MLAYIGEAGFNATKAAEMAEYGKGCPSSQGYQLLQHPLVAARIREELNNRAMSADAVLSELASMAMSPDARFSTTRYDPETGAPIEVRVDLNPKLKALELVGKAHGIFTERVDVSGSLTAQVELVGISEDDI